MSVLNPETPDVVDDTYRIVTELLQAAELGQKLTLTPRQCLQVAEKMTRHRGAAGPYLEAVVRQLGGRVHVDTRHLVASTGNQVKWAPDHDHGSGGVLWVTSDG